MWLMENFHRLSGVAVAFAIAALFSFPAPAADIRVPDDHPTIQAAIDAASAGDTVLVSNGVWSGVGNQDLDLRGQPITVASAGGAHGCVIEPEESETVNHRGFDLYRSEQRNTVIRGFTIRGGHAAGHFADDDGAGIRLHGSSPTIRDCVFSANHSGGAGGGIACLAAAHPLIENCTFTNNFGFDGGGAIGCNASSPVIRGNIMTSNGAYNAGGAILLYEGSSPEITGNLISDNAADLGGGIYCALNSSPLIADNRLTDNSCVWNGGGIMVNDGSSPQIRNNLLDNNYANFGAGLSVTYFSSAVVEHCTFFNNRGGLYGGAVHLSAGEVTITGCILWGNQADDGHAISLFSTYGESVANFAWCDIQGGENAVYVEAGSTVNYGPGGISADPIFVSGPDGPCYLSQTAAGQAVDSPCIDAGDPARPPPAGTTRTDRAPDGGVGDLGYHHEADWISVCDLDGSGRVDGGDLAILALAWGASTGEPRYDPRADINGSGTVDGDDLAVLASVFGQSL